MIKISNDCISAEISELGAELKSLRLNGEEVMWQGDSNFWEGTSPILFPICSALPDDKYTIDGKEYSLPLHGFAKTSLFTLEKQNAFSATLLLKESAETLKVYPWRFEFRVTFSLRGSTLAVTYDVKNLSENTMYFSEGSHEAFACPEGIEDYDILFPKKETLDNYLAEGRVLNHKTERIITESYTLPLYYKFFEGGSTLIFKDLKSRSATLRNRKTGRSITVDFPDCNYFLVWTLPNAPYICLEPWCGMPSTKGDSLDLDQKEGIIPLEPNGKYSRTHTVYF